METQKYETPEEALKDEPQSESPQETSSTFLERYKNFPWWVKYGPLLAIVPLLIMPTPVVVQILGFEIGTNLIMVAGLVAVLFSTISYRYFEHKSQFIHNNAQWFFVVGMLFVALAVILTYSMTPPPSVENTVPN